MSDTRKMECALPFCHEMATFRTRLTGTPAWHFNCGTHRPLIDGDDGTQECKAEGWSVDAVLDAVFGRNR